VAVRNPMRMVQLPARELPSTTGARINRLQTPIAGIRSRELLPRRAPIPRPAAAIPRHRAPVLRRATVPAAEVRAMAVVAAVHTVVVVVTAIAN
jgi:hypothetical protein